MADFAKILATVDKILGTAGLSHYIDVLAGLSADSLTGDCFILAVMELTDSFKGTSAELLAEVTPEKPPRGWPKNPRAVTTRLKRHAPALRDMGWAVDNDEAHNKRNALEWTLCPPEKERNSSSPSSLPRQNGEMASVASNECGPSQDVDIADLQAIGETDGDIEQFREDEAEYLSERGVEESLI